MNYGDKATIKYQPVSTNCFYNTSSFFSVANRAVKGQWKRNEPFIQLNVFLALNILGMHTNIWVPKSTEESALGFRYAALHLYLGICKILFEMHAAIA